MLKFTVLLCRRFLMYNKASDQFIKSLAINKYLGKLIRQITFRKYKLIDVSNLFLIIFECFYYGKLFVKVLFRSMIIVEDCFELFL